jgi:hypothetical protein
MNQIFRLILGLSTLGSVVLAGITPVYRGSGCQARTIATSINSNAEIDSHFWESVEANTIRVNDLCFEILVPEQVWMTPEPGQLSLLKIGLRITNPTAQPIRLYKAHPALNYSLVFNSLDGFEIHLTAFSEGNYPTPLYACRILYPSESLTFFLDNYLLWYEGDLMLQVAHGFRGLMRYESLLPGNYEVQFTYGNRWAEGLCSGSDFLNPSSRPTDVSGLWTGEVLTPSVQLKIIEPQ